jgi:hypothetical protein
LGAANGLKANEPFRGTGERQCRLLSPPDDERRDHSESDQNEQEAEDNPDDDGGAVLEVRRLLNHGLILV